MRPKTTFPRQQNLGDNTRYVSKYVKYFPVSEFDTLIKSPFSPSSCAPSSPCTRAWPLWPQAVQAQLGDTPSSLLRSLKLNESHRCRIHVNGIKNPKAELNSSQANQVCVALFWRSHRKENRGRRLFREGSSRKLITISVCSWEVTATIRTSVSQSQHLFSK